MPTVLKDVVGILLSYRYVYVRFNLNNDFNSFIKCNK